MKIFMAVLIFCYAIPAFSGHGSSGGAFAVVCRDGKSVVRSVELLDLAEAKQKGYRIRKSAQSLKIDYSRFLKMYRYYLGDRRPVVKKDVAAFFKRISRFRWVKNKFSMPHKFDIGLIKVRIPVNCMLEPFAFYADQTNTITVNRELWNASSSLTQTALYAHEIIYHQYRSSKSVFYRDFTSESAREIVPLFFTNRVGPHVKSGLEHARLKCLAKIPFKSNSESASTIFYVLRSSEKTIFQFTHLFDKPLFARSRFYLNRGVDLERTRRSSRGMVVVDPGLHIIDRAKMDSSVFKEFQIGVSFVSNQVVRLHFSNIHNKTFLQLVSVCKPIK